MKKKELRKIYRQKRADLTVEKLAKLQESIYQQVFKVDFSSVKNIHIFLSIARHKELDTLPIINFLRQQNKTIIISRSNFKTSTLSHFIFDENTKIEVNSWGIPEPVDATEIKEKQIDLVFVPLLISDQKNYRVGYGKGFYDRFLSECNPNVKTIGLNFFPPIKEIEDVNEYDIALNSVIYPQ